MADNGGARRRSARRWLWIIAGVAAAGAVAAVVGIWHLPDRMYPGSSDGMVQARAALQGGLLTAAAALTAVVGGLIALDETRQANAETRRANANTHVRELYVEAVKLLNDEGLGIRLGGIYALERIAVDSPADQRTVVEVLSAFVRVHSTDPALRPPPPAAGQQPAAVRPAADLRAAVQVLARLPYRADVPRADLTGADLTGPASLDRLTLIETNLHDVDLRHADLTSAWLGGANLTDANLGGANLTDARLGRADLTHTWLAEANLTSAWLDRANLSHAWLVGANLTGARLVGVILAGAQLGGVDLAGAVGLTQGQVEAARGDAATALPVGLARPASWS